MPDPAYRYSARVTGVHDGDNIRADVSLGFGVWMYAQSFRLLGLNARELADPGGTEARDNLASLFLPLATRSVVTLTSVKPDKFGGRFDAAIRLLDGTDLSALLIATGWAAPWNGRGAKPLPPWPREVP